MYLCKSSICVQSLGAENYRVQFYFVVNWTIILKINNSAMIYIVSRRSVWHSGMVVFNQNTTMMQISIKWQTYFFLAANKGLQVWIWSLSFCCQILSSKKKDFCFVFVFTDLDFEFSRYQEILQNDYEIGRFNLICVSAIRVYV